MTYNEDEEVRVPEPRMRVEGEVGNGIIENEVKGAYFKLGGGELEEVERGPVIVVGVGEEGGFFCWRWRWSVVWYWVKLTLLFVVLASLGAVFLKWVAPFVMDKELIPIINWETSTFSTPVLAILLFVSVALFPSLLLPSTPSMWVVGMTFGYGYGFLLLTFAVAVGVSLPNFIGSLFLYKIQGWLEKYPKKAAVLKAAGEGTWFNQFKTVTLIRISPFPYILYNYCSAATNVKYGPYLAGSLVGMLPDIFVAIYTGIFIRTLADASHEQHSLSASQVVMNVVGFGATVVTTIVVTVYAKRRLKLLKDDPILS